MDKKSTNNFLFYDLRKYFCKIEINSSSAGKISESQIDVG